MHDSKSTIDLQLIKGLLEKGADINFPDKHGQTVFMEVARGNILCLFGLVGCLQISYLVLFSRGKYLGSVIIFTYELFAKSCSIRRSLVYIMRYESYLNLIDLFVILFSQTLMPIFYCFIFEEKTVGYLSQKFGENFYGLSKFRLVSAP